MDKNYNYVIADHIRASCFIISDGVQPSGKQRGYILRRLIRRSLAASLKLGVDITNHRYYEELVDATIGIYDGVYNELKENREIIIQTLVNESEKYAKAIQIGQKEWTKILSKKTNDQPPALSQIIWDFYQTHGVPIEVSEDIIDSHGLKFDKLALDKLIHEHQSLSQNSSSSQFKSGLAEDNQKTRRLHTATHLLHQVLREMFGTGVRQMGSAITIDKARFDFTIDSKLEDHKLQEIESKIQNLIDRDLIMDKKEMSEKEARELGAIGLFGEKYGQKVTVHTLIDKDNHIYSREFCGGPHIDHTSEIGTFKILRQKSVGQGLRRLEFNVE